MQVKREQGWQWHRKRGFEDKTAKKNIEKENLNQAPEQSSFGQDWYSCNNV
jgi:hypothetical protein